MKKTFRKISLLVVLAIVTSMFTNIKRRMLQMVSMLLVIVMTISLSAPLQASAEEKLYLAYKYTGYGQKVVEFQYDWQKESYKVTQIPMNVGDRTELCFINATSWKNPKWTSSDTKVVAVDSNGVVKAVGEGVAEVKLTYSKRLTNRKVSATTTICVGEKNWGITIGPTEIMSICENLEMKVGGDLSFEVYGLPNSEISEQYDITWNSSDDKVAPFIGNQLYAKKAGKVTITGSIKNKAVRNTIKKKIVVNVTNPVYEKDAAWDNEYYRMYGENYKRLFSSTFLNINYETEKDLIDSAWEVLRGEQNNINIATLVTLTNLSEMLETGIKGMMQGKDYAKKENRLSALQYLLQEMQTDENTSQKYAEKVKQAFENAESIISEVTDLDDFASVAKALEKTELSISAKEEKSLLGFLMGDVAGGIKNVVSEGVTASEYMITTLCLYSAENEFLEEVQKASAGGDLYKDIELLKTEREKDPISWYKEKYFSDVAARKISKLLIEAAGKNAFKELNALHEVSYMTTDMAGVAKLSETVKATYLMSYLTDVIENIGDLRTEIKENFDSYTDDELIAKIEEYENSYKIYIDMIVPVLDAVCELEQYGRNNDIFSDTLIILGDKYDYNRHIATAMAAYLYANPDADPKVKVKNAAKPNVMPSPVVTISPTPTPTNTPSPTPTNTPSPTPTNTPSPTPTNTPSPTPTNTPSPTPTNTPSPTPTNTPSPTPTNTPSPIPAVTKVYGTLDLTSVGWSSYSVGINADFTGGTHGKLYPGAKLEILEECTNAKGTLVYKVYSDDLKKECYVTAKYVKVNSTVVIPSQTVPEVNHVNNMVYGTLDLTSVGWSSYSVGTNANFTGGTLGKIYQGAQLDILDEIINSAGNKVYCVYSHDLKAECYVSAKCVKISEGSQGVIPAKIVEGLYILHPKCAPNSALDVADWNPENGANLQIWETTKDVNQVFYIKRENGYYVLQSEFSKKMVDVAGGVFASQTNVQLYEANGSDAQKWIITDAGNGYYMLIPYGNQNLALDVTWGVNTNGANMWLYEKNNGDAQLFKLERYYGSAEGSASEQAQYKMNEALRKLGVEENDKNVYFTVNQKGCLPYWESSHDCDNCLNSSIVETSWFKAVFGEMSVYNFPKHTVDADWSNNAGWSCFGFASWLQYYIYCKTPGERLTGECIARVQYNKANIEKYAQPGDVIRVHGHSVVVYELQENGVVVVDCNWSGPSNCVVQKHLISYSNSFVDGYTAYINRVKLNN